MAGNLSPEEMADLSPEEVAAAQMIADQVNAGGDIQSLMVRRRSSLGRSCRLHYPTPLVSCHAAC